MKKQKYLKRIISIMMLLCLVVLGKFAMKAMVTTVDYMSADNKTAAVKTEADYVEAEAEADNGQQFVEKEDLGVQYEYDKLNRLTKVIYGDGSTISYKYDKNGNIVDSVVDSVVTSTPKITEEPTAEPTEEPTAKPTEEPTAEPTIEPTRDPANEVTVYYANSSWSKAYVHYKVNEKWTTSPGKLMETTTEVNGYTWKYTIDLGSTDSVTLMFTDGNGTWDKNSDGNKYVLDAGMYGIKNYTVTKVTIGSTAVPTVEPTVTPGNTATIYYANSSWSKAYIHYKVNEKWTTSPGKLMETTTEVNGYTWKYTIDLGSTDSVTFMFTDGDGTWDKNSDGNKYVCNPGVYGIKDYIVSPITVGNTTTVYYANSSWSKAYVHYKVDGKWTTTPGILMEATTEVSGYTWKYTIDLQGTDSVTLMFTDGNGTWDKNSDDNKYILSAGIYGIKSYKITTLSSGEPTPKITATPSSNIVTVYYKKSSFSKAYIHYKVGSGSWTTLPGVKMADSNLDGYTWMYTIDLGTATDATVCFNDGAGTWDSNGGSNYKVYTGRYGIMSGKVYNLNE